jgi:hypothetical protein
VKNTNLCPEFLLKIQKQQEDSVMLPASNKQEHKEMTKNTEKRTAEKNKDQVGLQEAPHLQDYTESFGIPQMLKFQTGNFHY